MGLSFAGYGETKAGTARIVVGSPQAAAMRFNDRPADPKSHAGPMSFGCKERIENLVRLLRGQPQACVADGYLNVLVFRALRLDDDLPVLIHTLQRIDAVHYEIHHHLLQLNAISYNPGKICCE